MSRLDRDDVDAPDADRSPRAPGPTLLDLGAVVVGYGLAALAARTLWPAGVAPRGPALVALLLAYGWLGLAMSGPFVLLRRSVARSSSAPRATRGRPLRAKIGRPLPSDPEPRSRYTRAETAWLLIGAYWILAAVLVLPTRLPTRSAPIVGLLPVVVAVLLWFVGPSRFERGGDPVRWTHHVARGLLATWPLAWLALILLTATYG